MPPLGVAIPLELELKPFSVSLYVHLSHVAEHLGCSSRTPDSHVRSLGTLARAHLGLGLSASEVAGQDDRRELALSGWLGGRAKSAARPGGT